MTECTELPGRSVIEVGGEDRINFLQGLVSNDVNAAAPGRAVWAAFLSPQGKWLADFFILSDGDRLLLDCEAPHAAALVQRLSRFKLRSKWRSPDAMSWACTRRGTGRRRSGQWAAPDPRLPEAGYRIISTETCRRTPALRTGTPSPESRPAGRVARPGAGEDGFAGSRVR